MSAGDPFRKLADDPYLRNCDEEVRARDRLLADALDALPNESCREETAKGRCNAPAEFILWGKLTKPDALGPRCYAHAAKHVGHQALGNPAWAILDLRPALRVRASASVLARQLGDGT